MSNHISTIRLNGELTIYQVGEVHEQLQSALQQVLTAPTSDQPPKLTIDTLELTEVDSAGLQLLVQVSQQALSIDIAIDWQTPGAALSRMIELYSAARWFESNTEAQPS